MLLVLSAPSIHNRYYQPAFKLIVDFQVSYAHAIMGNDNVVVIVDRETKSHYQNRLPDDILITAEVHDIWMRDFTTVNPLDPVQFKYTWASMSQKQSIEVQDSFKSLADQYHIFRQKANLLLDGGNIVDNYAGQAVTTNRFMEDNRLTYEQAKKALKKALRASHVAILEPDEDRLAHSDGMVMWVDENTLLVNDYSKDPEFRESVLNELKSSFPDVLIVEVPVQYSQNPPGKWKGFSSACGVNLNSVLTFYNLYVPVFNMDHDRQALDIIKQNTTRNVIPVTAEGVCAMGGSVRCLTWQLAGENANKLILAARKN